MSSIPTPPTAETGDAVSRLLDRERVTDTITALFVATDERDWAAVRACLAPEVRFDTTSLTGGDPQTLTAEQIIATWEEGLRPIEAVHHQAGNVRVKIDGIEATAACYGIAYHFRRHPSGRNTRVFVGSYDFLLRREPEEERWRITAFRFAAKFVDGNLELESSDE